MKVKEFIQKSNEITAKIKNGLLDADITTVIIIGMAVIVFLIFFFDGKNEYDDF